MSTTQQRPRNVRATENHPMTRAARTIEDAYAIEVPFEAFFERLAYAERTRLDKLCQKLRATPKTYDPGEEPVLTVMEPRPFRPHPDVRHKAAVFAREIAKKSAARPRVQQHRDLVIAFIGERERGPAPTEDAVLRGARLGSTLADLRGALDAADATPAAAAAWFGNLDDSEEQELEKLIAKAVDEKNLFKNRRARIADDVRLDLAGELIDGLQPTRYLAEGSIGLPEGVYDDLVAGHLHWEDAAVLVIVSGIFGTKRFDPGRVRDLRWEDDGDTLVVWGSSLERLLKQPYDGQLGSNDVVQRLTARGWLAIERRGAQGMRIRFGERLLAEREGR